MTDIDVQIADDMSGFVDDPLGYVMYMFPWDTDRSIQMVRLTPEYRERFNCEFGPDKWACEFLEDLAVEIKKRKFDGTKSVAPIRFSTASGHGIGKSTLVAWLIKFIMDTRPFSKGMVTATTGDQLRTKTWAELGKWHKLSLTEHWYDLNSGRGSMSLTHKEFKERWRCDAMTCREENSEAFQGLHAAGATPFYIFDEASGIPNSIFAARAGGLSDGEPMVFDFGNPTRKSGDFYENTVGDKSERYITRSIDSRSVAITNKELWEEYRQDYGEESDFFKVKVRGVFPTTGSVQFLSNEAVQEAMDRLPYTDRDSPFVIGVDVARFGDDHTVLYPRIGYDAQSFPYKAYQGLTVTQVADKVINMIQEFAELGKQCAAIFIDGSGAGGGVIDVLRRLGYNPIEVQFGGSPTNEIYRYKMDEMWGDMRDAMDKLALPHDTKLRNELTQREYGYTEMTHKLNLESKRAMKKRGIDSPDIADALAVTFFAKPALAVDPRLAAKVETVLHDYDPFSSEMING